MEKESLDFLTQLIGAISPSGYEQRAAKLWQTRTALCGASVKTDVHGNSIACLGTKETPRIMLAGHIDEIGYMIKYIDKEGFLYFAPVGGIDPQLMPGQRVWVQGKKDRVLGLIGKKPIHQLDESERKKVVKVDQLWIDIGVRNEEEARELVSVGDVAVPAVGLEETRNRRYVGRGFDDRAGAFTVSETLKALAASPPPASVFGVATVQEEIGIRGARTSAYGIDPHVGICVEVTFASDSPGMNKRKEGDVRLDAGPVLGRGPNINPKVFETLVRAAEEYGIPYQIEAQPRATGTDANVMQLTRAGVATGLVSIPLRYMHTPVELLSLNDVQNTVKLLEKGVKALAEVPSFLPSI
ncbi:MAG: M20/M25/M40 family metallo-hydrolase [Candidatus Omnitrophica bacterium]|nr:M20/M25/M40 family metallo-hydrolase [Candidatus Omnitrophota bacterium]